MSNPLKIESTGKVYKYIVATSFKNSYGSYYTKQFKGISPNADTVPIYINDGYVYNDEEYQCFTLASIEKNKPHKITAEKDCDVNFMLIGGGAPGCTSGDSGNKSSGPGGNAGSVITGVLNMKEGDYFTCSPYVNNLNSRIQVDTIEWMGEFKDMGVIGGDIKTKSSGKDQIFSQSAYIQGKINRKDVYITAGGASWPIASKENNVTVGPSYNHPDRPTLPCDVIGLDSDITDFYPSKYSDIIRDKFIIHRSRPGGLTRFNEPYSDPYNSYPYPSFGLASGYDWSDVKSISFSSVNILGNNYQLPCGGGGGGGSYGRSDNKLIYNDYSTNYNYAYLGYAGSGFGGGGFGDFYNDYSYIYTSAWMPGAGGGGARQDNKNEFGKKGNLNGYGGQGVMICWVKK